jgi:hypothetical protein
MFLFATVSDVPYRALPFPSPPPVTPETVLECLTTRKLSPADEEARFSVPACHGIFGTAL